MNTIRKAFAAVLSGILAAGMLSALPAEAARDQLGTYRKVGDSGLYLSDSGAIRVDAADCAGVQFSVQLPAQLEAAFRAEVREQLQAYRGYTDARAKDAFDLQREDYLTDTKKKGTEDNPVYTYSLTLSPEIWNAPFYTYISDLYYWLHTTHSELLQSFRYYADFGTVNTAGCYGYDVSGNPEMKEKIDAWLAEHAPGVVTRMSDDDSILNLGWDETDDGREYEPYCPYHDMYAIWQDLGYMPVYESTELYRHGEEFVIDFLQWQKYYDDISEEAIQGTMVKYGLDQVRSSKYQLMLGLPEDTVNALCKRSGSKYNTEMFYSPFEDLVSEYDLAEGLNIGFAAGIDLYHTKAPEKLADGSNFCAPEITSQLVRSGLYGGQSLQTRLHEDAHILAFLDRYLGLPFTACCAEPEETAPVLSKSFDELMKMDSAEISELTGTDFQAALERAGNSKSRPDVIGMELLFDRKTVDSFWENVVLEEPGERGKMIIDITVLSARAIEEYLHLPYGMVCNPQETTFYLPEEAKLGNTELQGITIGIDTTVYGKESRDKAYLLAMMYLDAADGIYEQMIQPTGGAVPFMPGDANLDGSVDVADAVLLARYCVSDPEAEITDLGMKRADANGDGTVTADDVTVILRKIAKKE